MQVLTIFEAVSRNQSFVLQSVESWGEVLGALHNKGITNDPEVRVYQKEFHLVATTPQIVDTTIGAPTKQQTSETGVLKIAKKLELANSKISSLKKVNKVLEDRVKALKTTINFSTVTNISVANELDSYKERAEKAEARASELMNQMLLIERQINEQTSENL